MEPKQINLPEIEKIVKAAKESVKAHNTVITNMHKFADQFVEMVRNECPEFHEKTKQIAALISGAMDQEQVISDAEQRLAEDLNDLSVRFDVLAKFGAEINAKKATLEACRRKITEIEHNLEIEKMKGGPKVYKLQGDIATQQQKKTETTAQLEKMLEQFIVMREKYAAFKVRRLEHGHKHLGQQIETALEIEKHLIGQLKRDCEQARDNLEDFFGEPPDIVEIPVDDEDLQQQQTQEDEE